MRLEISVLHTDHRGITRWLFGFIERPYSRVPLAGESIILHDDDSFPVGLTVQGVYWGEDEVPRLWMEPVDDGEDPTSPTLRYLQEWGLETKED